MFQIAKNTFDGGLNTDMNPGNVNPNQYIDATNVTLVASGKFFALQDVQGTTNLKQLGLTADHVLGVFETRYTIGANTNVSCLTIFTAPTSAGSINIFCYDIVNNFLYTLYNTSLPSGYSAASVRVIDAIAYPEKGLDVLYFTDNFFETRKIRCNIQAPYIGTGLPFLTDTNMAVARRSAVGDIQKSSVTNAWTTTGGTLLTGSYQLAYQLINLNALQTQGYGKYTRFSLLTTPIHVYSYKTYGGDTVGFAGVGMGSDQKITINILPTADELANYTHFRLAIVENIGPEGAVSLTAQVTESVPIATYLVGSVITNYQIINNYQNYSATLDEIVIDTAAIDHVKTLSVKNNRMFEGNITYKQNLYNNGTPTVGGGSILLQVGSQSNSFTLADFATQYKGHFRGEVYRYAIAYFDKYGNFSSPSVLDLTSVTRNQTTVDMKFPRRNQTFGATRYSLFDGATGKTQSVGLRITGIDHHPTWAQGFIILRVPRKKDVIFQTPIIPMCNVYGIGPLDNYPSIAQEGATLGNVYYSNATGTTPTSTGIQATPMGPNNVLYPMTYAWPKKRSIVKVAAIVGAGLNQAEVGESQLINDPQMQNAQVFPQGSLYTKNSPYVWQSSHQLDAVDAALLQQAGTANFNTLTNNGTTWVPGEGITSAWRSFYAISDTFYYYDGNHSGIKPSLRASKNIISGYAPFDNGSPGTTLNGKFVFTVDKLATGGAEFGFKPLVQKCGVIEVQSAVAAIDEPSGALLTYAAGTSATQSTFPDCKTSAAYGGNGINSVEIANVVLGLSDNRYGSVGTLYNYLYTGTKVVFTDAEISTNIVPGISLPKTVDVWGGDCFVAGFNFKLTDTIYCVVNQEKFIGAGAGSTSQVTINKWGRSYMNNGNSEVLTMPVALTNFPQYMCVVLESEFNGAAVDFDTASSGTEANGFLVYGNQIEAQCRSPLVYGYNMGVSKQNNQRVFVPVDPLSPVLTTLKSRLVFSNTKVYNSSIDGFDTIPVLNYYDLPETYGSITKLAIAENDLYSIQERGIAFLPIDSRVISTSNDSANLQVESGVVVNIPVWVDIKHGSQHLRSVKETGSKIFMVDNFNQAIYSLQNKQLTHISDKGLATVSRSILNLGINSGLINEALLTTVYDSVKNELWFARRDGGFCYVWNDNTQCWVSNYAFSTTNNEENVGGSAFINNTLYIVGGGVDTGSLQQSIYTMYTGTPAFFMGRFNYPSVKYIVAPSLEFGKTFDNLLINANARLFQASVFMAPSLIGINPASAINMSLNVNTRGEGNYRLKVLRNTDANCGYAVGARLRGTYANVLLSWDPNFPNTTLTSALMQWRPSFKAF